MKYVLMTFLFLVGCATTKTINLSTKHPNPDVYKLPTFEKCLQSGMQVLEDEYIEYYENCGVIIKRPLKERERKQWLLK